MGFMAEFSIVFSYRKLAFKAGYKPRSAIYLYKYRSQAPDMACGLVRFTLR